METLKEISSRQYWALRCATGIDYRDKKLNQEQFETLLNEANQNKGYIKQNKPESLLSYVSNDENIQKLVDCIIQQTNIKGILSSDTNDKKYVFIGSGCGIVWFDFDKRSKKVGNIIEISNKIKSDIDKIVVKRLKESNFQLIDYLKSCGNPIEAIQYQNEQYKLVYAGITRKYIFETLRIVVNVLSRLD